PGIQRHLGGLLLDGRRVLQLRVVVPFAAVAADLLCAVVQRGAFGTVLGIFRPVLGTERQGNEPERNDDQRADPVHDFPPSCSRYSLVYVRMNRLPRAMAGVAQAKSSRLFLCRMLNFGPSSTTQVVPSSLSRNSLPL